MRIRALALLLSLAPAPALAQSVSLSDLLARLDAYLLDYEQRLATVVAEERYEQELIREPSRNARPLTRTRVMRSDYALWRSPGGHAWTGYRDTYEVDGEPVRGAGQRLAALLADGTASSAQQALRLTRENARHNLGVTRTINVPTVALDLLHPRYRDRFTFERRGEEALDGRRAVVLAFRERGRPTLLRTPQGRDLPARGAVWVEPATGAVLRTDLSWDGTPRGDIVVYYRFDAGVGMLVPETMLEAYDTALERLRATAVYSGYRRFQTGARLLPPD